MILDNNLLFAQKTYGQVLAVRREQCGINQEQFARQNYMAVETLQAFEAGESLPSYEDKIIFSDALKSPILRLTPPCIDINSELITHRFNVQSISSKYFVDQRDNTLKERVSYYKSGYEYGIQHENLDDKSHYDHCLHQLIISFYPNDNERELVSSKQLQHIRYFREWAIHLGIPEFRVRPDNIGNHKELFTACVSGTPEDIEDILETHSKGSLEDISTISRYFKADSTGINDLAGTSLERQYLKRVPLQIDTEAVSRMLLKISGSALKIFVALGSRLGSDSNIVEIPTAELETITNLSKQTVRQGLNELVSLQLITRIGSNVNRKYLLNEMYLKRGK
ncbi:helix-turn-helix domain-containing protein [Nostoc sp. 'Peltigera membranacea cyanobiont' 232]|uniref:helix-turn-helix domain-containing protein n=1 Tax=Nostoc sp. 'Peltigera membranacea cyanobiont' 232 TaxID=2014531 RepID=UPI000B95914E|nr:helix-turn-helix transcriptional regulator [Nostoc sp. 'Peltigera membranacea cyanobiont' 232]OYE02742.1 hypothetical protein CDG79_22430 [Nostoc sp. 'Peltigera membranacea cyanobiont' 232]